MTTDMLEGSTPAGLQDIHTEAFLVHLRTEGYAERTIHKKRSIVAAFVRWAKSKQLSLDHLCDSDLTTFVNRSPGRKSARVQFELAALRLLLEYLQTEAEAPLPVSGGKFSADDLTQRYMDYLRQDLGLAENSVRVYVPFVRDFLANQIVDGGCLSPCAFDVPTIRNYLLAHSIGRSGEYLRLLTIALRSFFHFLFIRGDTPIDLCVSVPSVRRWRQSSVPAYLTPEEEERVLASTDRLSFEALRGVARPWPATGGAK